MRIIAVFAAIAVVCSSLLGCSSGGRADGPSKAVASSGPAVAAITTPPIAMRDYPFYDAREGCSRVGSLGDLNQWWWQDRSMFNNVAVGKIMGVKVDPLCKAVTLTVYTANASKVGHNTKVTPVTRQVVEYDGRADVKFNLPKGSAIVLVFWGKPRVEAITLKGRALSGPLLWQALLAYFDYSPTVSKDNGGRGLLWATTGIGD